MSDVKDLVSQATELEAKAVELAAQAAQLQDQAAMIRQELRSQGFQHKANKFCIDRDGDLKISRTNGDAVFYLDAEALPDFLAWLTSACQ